MLTLGDQQELLRKQGGMAKRMSLKVLHRVIVRWEGDLQKRLFAEWASKTARAKLAAAQGKAMEQLAARRWEDAHSSQ